MRIKMHSIELLNFSTYLPMIKIISYSRFVFPIFQNEKQNIEHLLLMYKMKIDEIDLVSSKLIDVAFEISMVQLSSTKNS